MPCPHGHGPPSGCSQCHGATARRVDLGAGQIGIDGVYTSAAAHEEHAQEVMSRKPQARRGGRHSRRAKAE